MAGEKKTDALSDFKQYDHGVRVVFSPPSPHPKPLFSFSFLQIKFWENKTATKQPPILFVCLFVCLFLVWWGVEGVFGGLCVLDFFFLVYLFVLFFCFSYSVTQLSVLNFASNDESIFFLIVNY